MPIKEGSLIALKDLLQRIEIRDPLRQLINPKLELVPINGDVELSIRINTFERNTGTPFNGLESRFPLPNTPSSDYWIDRFLRQPEKLAAFINQSLVLILEHETAESIWFNESRLFEPKHWGPEDTQKENKQ